MAVINRLYRLFQADFHAVLDNMEEPEVLLRQAVREMEAEILTSEQQLKSLHEEYELLNRRRSELEQAVPRIEAELDTCFEVGNEVLAKKVLQRKLETQLFLAKLKEKLHGLEKTIVNKKTELETNRTRFAGMRQKAELLCEESRRTQTSDKNYSVTPSEYAIREEEIEVAFLQEQQKRRSKTGKGSGNATGGAA